jgi:hypothetical protein
MHLIDTILPYPDFTLRHSVVIDAPAHAILESIASAKAGDDVIVRWLVGLRRVPSRGFRAVCRENEGFNLGSFTPLVRGQYGLAYGMVGRFWRAAPDVVPISDLAAFERFNKRGFAKLVLSFELHALTADRTKLSTFTHVRCDDTKAWLAMSLYWAAIRLGIGLVRRRYLRQIRLAAEAQRALALPGRTAR